MKVPSSDNDLIALCDRFGNAERCIRGIAKDCLTGLHKTTTSTVSQLEIPIIDQSKLHDDLHKLIICYSYNK